MQGLDFSTFSSILATTSIILGIILSLNSARNYIRARKLEMFHDFHKLSLDKEFLQDFSEITSLWTWESTEEFFSKYGPEKDLETFAKFTRVGSYFDGMGKILEKGLIDVSYIPEFSKVAIISYWNKVQPWVDEMDMAWNRPGSFNSIKHLYEEIMGKSET